MQNQITGSRNILLLGGIILDRYHEVEHYPVAGQDTLIRRSYDRVGGCALNVAVTLKNLGSKPYVVNKFGDDEIGGKIGDYIQALSISTACMLKITGRQTGYCLTMLDPSGERTFFTYKGCEVEFSLNDFPAVASGHFGYAYITGYYLMNRQTAAAVLALAQQLRQNGCQIFFDPGPLVAEMDHIQLRELIRLSDWVIPNETELAIILKKLNVTLDVLKRDNRKLAVKKGSQGVDIYSPGANFSIEGLPVKARDTTGAGDSFAGGFIHALSSGYSLREAVILANACGAFCTLILGPHGVFTMNDMHTFMAKFKDSNL